MAQGKPVEAEVSARRAKLIRLRREGVRYDDPRILNLGYSDSGAARKDVIRALERNRAEEVAEVGVYRQQENERLDTLLEAVWDKATTPSPVFDREHEIVSHEIDLKAVDTVLKLMDRRAKLNGLDMPVRAECSPRGRGCSGVAEELAHAERVFPARAGACLLEKIAANNPRSLSA